MKILTGFVLSLFMLSNMAFAADEPTTTPEDETAKTTDDSVPSESGTTSTGLSTAAKVGIGIGLVGVAAALSGGGSSTTNH